MFVRVWIAALLGAFVLFTPGAASAAPGPYPPPTGGGSGSVTPSRACAGQCVTFSGNGFAPDVIVVIRDDGRLVGTARTDANGEFSTQVCFGTDARPGRHTLTATGTGADGKEMTVSAVVFVCGVSQRPPPPSGDGGGDGNGAGDGDGAGDGAGDAGAGGNGDGGAGGDGAGGGIPFTGFMGSLIALAGILLVAMGSALLVLLERRHTARRRAHRLRTA